MWTGAERERAGGKDLCDVRDLGEHSGAQRYTQTHPTLSIHTSEYKKVCV